MRAVCVACRKQASVHPYRSLHKCPDDPVKRKAWITSLSLDYETVQSKEIYVCSDHFKESDYFVRSLNGGGSIRLHRSAVPTYNKVENEAESESSGDDPIHSFRCVVPCCRYQKTSGEDSTIKFFPFRVAKIGRRLSWLNAIGLDNVPADDKICSRHFDQTDMYKENGTWKLKSGAEPKYHLDKIITAGNVPPPKLKTATEIYLNELFQQQINKEMSRMRELVCAQGKVLTYNKHRRRRMIKRYKRLKFDIRRMVEQIRKEIDTAGDNSSEDDWNFIA